MTRRNELKWTAEKNEYGKNLFISNKVQIDTNKKDSFRLERKQKLNPTTEHPYTYELSWSLNFILSHENHNIPLYEFGQWFFAEDVNWYEDCDQIPTDDPKWIIKNALTIPENELGAQPESGGISNRQAFCKTAVDSLNVQINGLEKKCDALKRNIKKFQDKCDHNYILCSLKQNFMRDALRGDSLFGKPINLYICTNCNKEKWEMKNG